MMDSSVQIENTLLEQCDHTTLANEELFEYLNGLWKGKKPPYVNVKVLRNTNFNNDGTLSLEDVAELPVEEKQFRTRKLVAGDIILERSGGGPKQPVGRVVFFDLPQEDYSFSNFTTCIRVKDWEVLNPEFLLYYLLSFYNQGNTNELQQRTTGIRNLNFSDYKKIAIPLPMIKEQTSIIFVLRKLQQAIAQQEQIIAKTKELKRSLMHRLFTYGLRGEEIKETEIGLMPKSWNVVSLRDYVELITKGSSPNWQGFEYCQEGITFIRSQNIGWGDLLLNEVQHLPEGFNKKEKKSIIKQNDVLINLVGASIGRVTIATKVIEGGNLNQAVAIVRLRLNSFTPKFLVQYLLTQRGQKQIHLNKKEIARANISLQDVNNFLVVRPEMEEQEEITKILSNVDKRIQQSETRKQTLQALFKSMLQLLMTGQVRVKDIDFGEINV